MNRDFNFEWKFKDFAIKTVRSNYGDKSSSIRKNCPIELIKYVDEKHSSCFVVAWWELDDGGYELHGFGDRLFKHISTEEITRIWPQLRAAQTMLDEYFKACEEEEWADNCGN